MKHSFSLVSKLYSLSLLWFVGSCLSILYFLMNLFFPSTDFILKQSNSVWGNKNIFKNGYDLKVNMLVKLPSDTIIYFEKDRENGTANLDKDAFFRFNKIDTILNDTNYKKQFYLSTWITEDYEFSNNIELNHISYNSEFDKFATETKILKKEFSVTPNKNYGEDVIVKMKTNSRYKNFLLIIYNLLPLFTSLLISIFSMRIFKSLYKKINFKKKIARSFLFIALLIILQQIGSLILTFIFSRWFSLVHIKELAIGDKFMNRNNNIFFNPTLDFSFSMLFLGLSLIVVSYILRYGNQIEEENALTV